MKNEVEYNKILENNIEGLKCYNNILKNNKINCYEYGWMKTFKIELNDMEYKREFKKYLENVDLKQKEKYIDLMEFVKWINICYKLDVFKINKIVQDYIDVEYVKYKSAGCRATLNPILKINRMIRYYHDLLIQLNLLSETPEQPPQLTKKIKTDVQNYLFIKLKEKNFIPENTNFNHFCFVFGSTPIPAKEQPFKPIKWKECKQSLRMLLLCDAIRNKTLKQKEIKEITKKFIHKNNKPFTFSSNQPKTTTNISIMKHIIQDIPTV
jgi:hypothetical protein